MKIKLTEIFKLLKEAQCPRCNAPNAYVGMNDVECPNPDCTSYSPGVPDGAVGLSGQGGGSVLSDDDKDTILLWIKKVEAAVASQDIKVFQYLDRDWDDVTEIFNRLDQHVPAELAELRDLTDSSGPVSQDLAKEISSAERRIGAM